MPCKTPELQTAYQRKWVATRRAEFFADKSCVDCGSTERLELDHVDPADKTHHAIWSWAQERREAEIAKCVVRCRSCHTERHAAERRRHGIKRYEKGCRCDICRAAKREANARYQRRRPGSNRGTGLCRPVHSHSATPPGEQLTLPEAA